MFARRARKALVLAWVPVYTALIVACSGQGSVPVSASAATASPTTDSSVDAAAVDSPPVNDVTTSPAVSSEETDRDEYNIAPNECNDVTAEDVRSIVGPYHQILGEASAMNVIAGVETDCAYVSDDASARRSIYVAIYRPDKSNTSPDEWTGYWTKQCIDLTGRPPEQTSRCYSDGTLTINKGYNYLEVTIRTPEITDNPAKTRSLEEALAEQVLSRLSHLTLMGLQR